MRLSATATPGKENRPSVQHGGRCDVRDPTNMDAEDDSVTQASYDYHGAYEEFVMPSTGRMVRVPTSVIEHYDRDMVG